MAEKANNKNLVYVKDLFSSDFFVKLGYFIFDENFDEFYDRKLSDKINYQRLNYDHPFLIPYDYLDENIENEMEYPLNFETFYEMYNKGGEFAKVIDKMLFQVKYLMKELFQQNESSYMSNKHISIILHRNIVIDFYSKLIIDYLYNCKLDHLHISNSRENEYLFFEKTDFNIVLTKRILFSVFAYVISYLENLLENLLIDNESLIEASRFEAGYNIIMQIKNVSTQKRYLAKNLKEKCLKSRNQRLLGKSGRTPREIIGAYFPKTKAQLDLYIKSYSKRINSYDDVLRIIKECKFKNKDIVIENLKNYIDSFRYDSSMLYLDENGKLIETEVIKNHLDDDWYDLYPFFINYIHLMHKFLSVTIPDVIIYTLLEQSGNLELFGGEKEYSIDAVRKFFERKKADEPFFKKQELFKLYKTKEFQTLHRNLFGKY
ncbi:MAG: hypothetical protein NC390_00505 [Fusobacterium sp.]|nr:hypothetical protein [Fusobacterium sp.]